MAIPPADMVLFAAVVREGSFTKAARRLAITKQTASERIGKLEERLGVRLLERTTRRLKPTETGADYYEKCAAIAAQIDEANAEVMQRQSEPVGTLRVTAPSLYGRRFLGPVVTAYLERYPRMRAEVLLTNRRVELIEEGIDLAIRVGMPEDQTMVVTKLDEGHAYYVASPGFLAERGALRPDDLPHVRCIGLRPWEAWEVQGRVWKVEPVLVVNDLEVACEAAVAGLGVAELPALVCRDAVRAGRLRVLFGAEPAVRRTIYAVYPSRRHLPSKVRLFVELLAARVAPMHPLEVEAGSPRPPRRRRGGVRREK